MQLILPPDMEKGCSVIASRFAYWRYGAWNDGWLGQRAIIDVAEPCEVEFAFFLPQIDLGQEQKTVAIVVNGELAREVAVSREGMTRSGVIACPASPTRIQIDTDLAEPGRLDDTRMLGVHVSGVWINGERMHLPIFDDLITGR